MKFSLAIKNTLKKIGLATILKRINKFLSSKNNFRVNADGTATYPTVCTFEITSRCNLSCQMCYLKKEERRGADDLSLDQIVKIIDKLDDIKKFSLIGGEIFSRPDIFDILEEFKKRKKKIYLTTNGTLLTEGRINKLKDFKGVIQGIGFSIDGPEEIHDVIRGGKGLFNRTVDTLIRLKNDFNVSVNTVLLGNNLKSYPGLVKYLGAKGIINFTASLEFFAEPKDVLESKHILHEENLPLALDIKNRSNYAFELEDLNDVISEISEIKGISFELRPKSFFKDPKKFFDGQIRSSANLGCGVMPILRVNNLGDVIFCPFIKKKFGNMLENKFEDIWNGEEIVHLRKSLLENNLLPICKRCCRLK